MGQQNGQKLILREMPAEANVVTGAERTAQWMPLLKGKRVAVVANQTSVIGRTHLVDTMIRLGLELHCVFAPEHGFRGQAGAGEQIESGVDTTTGLPVISLYGKKRKPDAADLHSVDVVVFDIQDVGARFYTYGSTLQYVMEACGVAGIPVVVFDRPNPNGFYVDGPLLDTAFASFVGMNPIPVVHGLTLGEYAGMMNGERWLADSLVCDLEVIRCEGYSHFSHYTLPVPPSPNLPNMSSVYLYPSLCFFEGTAVSVARGTPYPFQAVGYPGFESGDFEFTPTGIPGKAMHPKYEGEVCRGFDLRAFGTEFVKNHRKLYLFWLLNFYASSPDKENFFNGFFDKLAGGDTLRQQIMEGWHEEEIRASWSGSLDAYKRIRKKYLLYTDFE